MFGKSLADTLRFQEKALAAVAVVGLLRLALPLAGVPNAAVAWLSMSVVAWAGALYYGFAAERSGFGDYRHLLPLALHTMVVQQSIAVLGIMLAIAGFPNVFGAPEYSMGVRSQWVHALSHLTIGIVVPTLLMWAAASLVLAVTRRVGRRETVAYR
jgi:hypothetical protein